MTVVMMGQMSLENSVEKSKKKNDQDQVDGRRQEVYSKGKEMHNEKSNHQQLTLLFQIFDRHSHFVTTAHINCEGAVTKKCANLRFSPLINFMGTNKYGHRTFSIWTFHIVWKSFEN